MIKPHGANALNPRYVADGSYRAALIEKAELLPSLVLNSAAAANAVMLGGGYFTPLDGFMDLNDALSIAESMQTDDGLFWPVPILNLCADVSGIGGARRIALRDPNVPGEPVLAVMEVTRIEAIGRDQLDTMIQAVFGTTDDGHPGVAEFRSLGRYCVSGPIDVLNFSYFERDFPDTFRTAADIRAEIGRLGWETSVAFQTRNPMHLAHETLCRMAMERLDADGLVIHMLLGKLKPGDIPGEIRDACIRKMVQLAFPADTVMVTGYGFDMLYAGPREALLHALFRQNMGVTHLIVGRDHAGVGDYYGPFDAQAIFNEIPSDALEIDIFPADHAAWSKKLAQVV
ncbi:MAG: sulfate adenylyltransferase, partial [Proteobacteria bacterium]|nr:sulfate adenylyltransferase [Pseudomonadota bacterium]